VRIFRKSPHLLHCERFPCQTAIVKVYNGIVAASDAGKMTILVMLDYSAAFDTVDHCILLDILRVSFGLSGAVLSWVSSHLPGRTQVIHASGSISGAFI
jgi:hypothetical protein